MVSLDMGNASKEDPVVLEEDRRYIRRKKNRTTVAHLPNELLLGIFDYFNRSLLLSTLSRVCRRWRHLIVRTITISAVRLSHEVLTSLQMNPTWNVPFVKVLCLRVECRSPWPGMKRNVERMTDSLERVDVVGGDMDSMRLLFDELYTIRFPRIRRIAIQCENNVNPDSDWMHHISSRSRWNGNIVTVTIQPQRPNIVIYEPVPMRLCNLCWEEGLCCGDFAACCGMHAPYCCGRNAMVCNHHGFCFDMFKDMVFEPGNNRWSTSCFFGFWSVMLCALCVLSGLALKECSKLPNLLYYGNEWLVLRLIQPYVVLLTVVLGELWYKLIRLLWLLCFELWVFTLFWSPWGFWANANVIKHQHNHIITMACWTYTVYDLLMVGTLIMVGCVYMGRKWLQ